MISRIRGQVVARSDDAVDIMTSGGVGYHVEVPLTALEQLLPGAAEVELHTELVVREDAHLLFGFTRSSDRIMFNRLRSVSGVGPRTALAFLSTWPVDVIRDAIATRDLARLTAVSGVGRKIAERIALELGDKMGGVGSSESAVAAPVAGTPARDAIQALERLGYTALDADRAVRKALNELPDADVQALIKLALSRIK